MCMCDVCSEYGMIQYLSRATGAQTFHATIKHKIQASYFQRPLISRGTALLLIIIHDDCCGHHRRQEFSRDVVGLPSDERTAY